MIGIGFIGAGLMAGQHARSLSGLAKKGLAELRAVYAADLKQARDLATSWTCEVADSLHDLLERPDIDAVLIATPTDTHAELALQAIQAGKHVFVEKPVATRISDAHEMRRAADQAGVILQVGHVIRYFDEYRTMHKAVTSGSIGDVAVATFGRRCQKPEWAPDKWHTSMARSGGVIVDMMIHDIDLARWMFGEPRTVFGRTVGSDLYDGLDYAVAVLTYGNGSIVHLNASWCEPDGFSQSAEICGSLGMITYDSRSKAELQLASHSVGANSATALPAPPPDDRDPFLRQLADFVAAIDAGDAPIGGSDWAVASLEIAMAILESTDTNTSIDIASWRERNSSASLEIAQ